MRFVKEIVCEPGNDDKKHFSSTLLDQEPFSTAQIFEGGYGKLDKAFYVERVCGRGWHSIVLSLAGMGRVEMEDGTIVDLPPGSIFVSHSDGQGHREQAQGDALWEMLWFSARVDSPTIVPAHSDFQVITMVNTLALKQILFAIFDEVHYSDADSHQAIAAYETLFLIHFLRATGWTENLRDRKKRSQLLPLWQEISRTPSSPWSVVDLCNRMNMSRSQLTRICFGLYGKAPGEMVKDIKMDRARLYVLNTELPIARIAEKVGYENANTFSTAYAHYFGVSPQKYRGKALARSDQ